MKLSREVNGKKISFTPLNSKTLELETTGVITEIKYSEDIHREITSITIADDYKITRYGEIKIPQEDRVVCYEINHILQIDKKKFLLLTHLRNKCSTYLLPSLGLLGLSSKAKALNLKTQTEIAHYCYNTYLINAYINPKNLAFLELVFRFSTHNTYKLLEECLIEHPRFIKIIDGYKKDDYVAFRMEIPEEYQSDVITFFKGLYSEFSPGLKAEIIRFHRANKKSRLHQILYKDPKLREFLEKELMATIPHTQELDSIPDRNQELIEIS